MKLWAELHRLAILYPEGPLEPIAEEFLGTISHAQLIALLVDGVATMRRHDVRGVEREAFAPQPPDEVEVEDFDERVRELNDTRPAPRIPREQFAALLDRTFALSGRGPRVRWGEATVEQHQQRIHMLEGQVGGLLTTVDRHKQAIGLIEEEHVTCLNEALRPAEV